MLFVKPHTAAARWIHLPTNRARFTLRELCNIAKYGMEQASQDLPAV